MRKETKISIGILIIIALIWTYFFPYFYDEFVKKYLYLPFLGILAATVANTTPAAAGIVYFPVLTHLNILPITAVRYNLLIQAYGMGLGTFKWYLLNKKLFLFKVLPVCILGGAIGCFFSIVLFPIKNPEVLKIFFNVVSFSLTQFIFFSILKRKQYPNSTLELNTKRISAFFILSLIGGMVSGWIGFGIDTIFYFFLTIFFRINPAIAIVTSISLMTFVSIFGSLLNLIFHSVPLSLWFSAIPGVTIGGLFLAAYLAIKLGSKNILLLFCLFLTLEFFLTLWTQNTIRLSYILKMLITNALVIYLLYIHVRIFKISYKNIEKNN